MLRSILQYLVPFMHTRMHHDGARRKLDLSMNEEDAAPYLRVPGSVVNIVDMVDNGTIAKNSIFWYVFFINRSAHGVVAT